jgi:rhodanese-related sulfurtransferase
MFSEFVMQNLIWFGALIVVLNLLIFSYMQSHIKGVSMVSPLQLPSLQRNGKTTIIDVNDNASFAISHIPDAVNFSVDSLNADNSDLMKHKNSTTILVCQAGNKSTKAAKLLLGLGFNDIHILRGGLMAWAKENLPLTNT